MDVNSVEYWDSRFSSGNWEEGGGRQQTANFAEAQVGHFGLPEDFSGTILDFGCGLGDAMPVYRRQFPKAKLMGLDISESGIQKCRDAYRDIATFLTGTAADVPSVDVIVASNVLEHLSDDLDVATQLKSKCRHLYIVVPYREFPLIQEHLRSYDEDHFRSVGQYTYSIFSSRGWSQYGLRLVKLNVENVVRRLAGRAIHSRRMQILFRITGDLS